MSKTTDLKIFYEKEYIHVDELGFEEKVVADIKLELLMSIFPGEAEVSSFMDIGCGKVIAVLPACNVCIHSAKQLRSRL